MSVAAFCVLGVLLGGYVVLDGYDLGTASILLFVARSGDERQSARNAIAPFWNGNEVFLVAAGASLFAFFPQVYASSFSGFYLPFMVVLWLLMGRGIAFEIREMIENALWHAFWDVAFSLSSLGLVAFFGVALGNIVRGVPLQQGGYFLGLFGFLFNGYACAVALLAVLALCQHGAAYLIVRTQGPVAERSRGAAIRLFPAVAAWWAIVSIGTFFVRSPATFGAPPAIGVGAAVALGSLIAFRIAVGREPYHGAFVASSCFLAGLLLSAAGTIFPYLLPGFPDPRTGLDIYRTSAPPAAMTTALTVTILALVLLAGYRTFLARKLTGRGT
jgi:cytochrome d ubiquinol oxidase subunit II